VRLQDYDGADLLSGDGDKIGTVERSYVDGTGYARFVEVKIGTLLAKHRLVPTDGAQRLDTGLQVPFSKDVVEGSPDAKEAGDDVDSDFLRSVRAYYDGAVTDDEGTAAGADAGESTADDASTDGSPADDSQDGANRVAAIPAADVPGKDIVATPVAFAASGAGPSAMHEGAEVWDAVGDKVGTVTRVHDVGGEGQILEIAHGGVLGIGTHALWVPITNVQEVRPDGSVVLACAADDCTDQYSTKPTFVSD
jgi:hypothetical protein